MDADRIKHLEFIQDVITRMNKNSFQIKGWAITIVSALLALFAGSKNDNEMYLFVAVVPAILFWFLDTYYLQQERKFRGLYNDVAGITKGIDRKEIREFEMPIQKYTGGQYNFFKVMWSKTIWPLYLSMVAGLLVGGILLSK